MADLTVAIRGARCLSAGESMLDEAARFDPDDWCEECGEEITETESDPPRVWVRVCGCGVSRA